MSIVLGVSACSSVPMGSIVPLLTLDIATTRADALMVGLQLPETLRAREGGVVMDLLLKRDGHPDQAEQFLLEAVPAADLAGINVEPGNLLFAYRIAPVDVPRFAAVQEALSDAKARRIVGSLGFGIAMHQFCRTGSETPTRPLASTYLRTAENPGWLTITDRYDLASDPAIAAGLAALEPCQA